MIDLTLEKPITLTEATKIIPAVDGRRRHPSAVWRDCKKGVKIGEQRIRLEFLRIGRRIVTTREALNRFFQRLAEADVAQSDAEEPAAVPTCDTTMRKPTRRDRDVTGAIQRMEALAIGV